MAKSEQTRITHIGKYRLLARIGQGGMGTVYQARQESLDKIVALKVLAPSLARQQDFVERFIREAQSSGQLSHPNIVLGFDAGEADGYYYFAMEFVDGEDLKTKLDRDGKLPERRALEITAAMAAALEHAHGHNIVHRDIKPGNILVTRDGTPKLADLGLAKEIRSDHSITLAGIPVGTPFYISPEQIRGQQNVDGRADLYALGASLYHMVAGAVPYEGPTSAIVMTRHLNDPIPDPRQHTAELSDGAVAIIRHAMAKKPEDRYQTATELREDSQAVLAGKAPRHARKGQAALAAAAQRMAERRAREAAKRRKLIIAGSAAGGVALLAIVLALVLRGGGGDTKTQGVAIPPPRPATPTSSTPLPRPIPKKLPATATPAIAKPSADAVYRELLDYASSSDDRDHVEDGFRKFLMAHAGSAAAGKAKEHLAELKSGWKAEDDLKAAVRDGIQQKKFAAAFAALDKPPFKTRSKKQDELIDALAQEAKRAAAEHVAAETAKAEELVQRGDFPAARDVYKSLAQLGLPDAAEASQAALKKLDALEAERRQRLAQRTLAEKIVECSKLLAAGELDKARALFDPQQAKGEQPLAQLLKDSQADFDRLRELFDAAEQKLTDLAAQNGTAFVKGIGRKITKVEDHFFHCTLGERAEEKFAVSGLAWIELEKLGCGKEPLQRPLFELYRNKNLRNAAKTELEKLAKEPPDPVVARCLREVEWVDALAREEEAGALLAKAQKLANEKSWKDAADSVTQLSEKFAETGFVEKNRPAIQDLSKRIGEAVAAARREAETIRPFIDVTEKCGDLGKALKALKPVGGWVLDIDHDKEAMPDIALDIRHGEGGSQLVPIFLNKTAPGSSDLAFSEATKDAGLETGDEPLCWVDLDGDGRPDVLYRGLRQPGEGAWAKDHARLGIYQNRSAAHAKDEPLFRHQPDAAIKADPAIVAGLGGFGFGNLAVLDANGDGRPDILAQFAQGLGKGTLGLFLAVPGKSLTFTDASVRAGFLVREGNTTTIPDYLQLKAWPQYVVLDADGDGKADFILNAEAGLLFRNLGNGRFVYDAKSSVKYQTYAGAASNNNPAIIPAVADYDNDAKIDIFVPQRGRSLLLRNEGGGKFVDAMPTTGDMNTDEGDALWATWGDVNNDGLLDLFVCYADRRNRLYIQKANHCFVDKAEEYGVAGQKGEKTNFAVFADLNRDGALDLAVLRDNGHSQVLLNPLIRGDNHYSLSVVVRTPLGAIGAKVSLIRPPAEILGLQQIGRCEGYNRQTAQEAFFGVPVPGDYLVKVVLSDGSKVIQRPVTVNPARRNILILDK